MSIEKRETQVSTSTSTQIIIRAQTDDGQHYAVGAVKDLVVNQAREIRRELNDDGSIRFEPGPTSITINVNRMVFDGLSLTEAFGQSFRAIAAQSHPFHIQIIDTNIVNDKRDSVVTTYKNCWFQAYSTPIKADSYIILEQAVIWCEEIEHKRVSDEEIDLLKTH